MHLNPTPRNHRADPGIDAAVCLVFLWWVACVCSVVAADWLRWQTPALVWQHRSQVDAPLGWFCTGHLAGDASVALLSFMFGLKLLSEYASIELVGVAEIGKVLARQLLQRGPALLAAWAFAAVLFPVLAQGSELYPLNCSTLAAATDLLTLGFLWKPVQRQCAPWAAFAGTSLLSVSALVLVAAATARFGAVTVDATAALYELSRDACIWAGSRLGVGRQCRAGLRRMGCGPLAVVPAHVPAQDLDGSAAGGMDGRGTSGSGVPHEREASAEQVLGDRRMAPCHVGRGRTGAKWAVIAAFCCLAAAWPIARLVFLPGPLPIGRPLLSVRAAAAGDNPVLSRFTLQPVSAWGAPFLGAAAGGLAALSRGTSTRGVRLGVLGRIAAAAALPCLVLLVQADWHELGMLAPSPGTGADRYRGMRFYWMGLVIAMQRPLLVAACAALLHAWVVVGGAEWVRGLRLSHLSRLDAWSWGFHRAMTLFGCSSRVEFATGAGAAAGRKDITDAGNGLSVDGTLRALARHSQAACIASPLVACLMLQLMGPPWPATPGVLMPEQDDQGMLPRPDTGSFQLQSLHMLTMWAATCAGSMLVAVPLQAALDAPLQWAFGHFSWLRTRHVPWLLRPSSSAVRCDLLMGAAEPAALSSSGSGSGSTGTDLVGDSIAGRRQASATARWGPDGDALLRVAEADGSQSLMKGVLLGQLRVHKNDGMQGRSKGSNAAPITGATSTLDELPATGAAAAAIATASARDRGPSVDHDYGNRVTEPNRTVPGAPGGAQGTLTLMEGPAFAGRCAGLYALAALPHHDAEDIGGRAVAVVLGWYEMVGAEDQQAVEAARVAVQVLEDGLGLAAEREAAAALEGGTARGGRLRRTRAALQESSESSGESSDRDDSE